MTMDSLVFIVDMNELEHDSLLPVSMDFTVNFGPFVRGNLPQPAVGDTVKIHYDEDDTLYFAKVVKIVSDRDLIVDVDWTTCAPVLNKTWSAREDLRSATRQHPPTTSDNYSLSNLR
jgi:hypothetical protein